MKNTSKSLWHKPEMIVLVRSNPEELVLGGCKVSGSAGANRPAAQACEHPSTGPCANITGT